MSANGAADIGLAVMGQNLALNITNHGCVEAAFNCTVAKVDGFLAGPAKDTRIIGAHAIEELVSVLKRPRRVMLMIKAIAAQVPEGDPHGTPCCGWVDENGAGHFVKMVHNADLQLSNLLLVPYFTQAAGQPDPGSARLLRRAHL